MRERLNSLLNILLSKKRYSAVLLIFVVSVAYAATNFTAINVSGNITVGGTVDGRDVSTDGSVIDSISTNGVGALTSAEVDQLENIDSNLISNAEWGYVATQDQSTNSTASPTWITPTVTNLNANGFLDFLQIATPSNPAASHNKLYFKSDGNLYKLDSAGVETAIAGGGGGANTTLSNLTSPTSINQHLIPDANNTRDLGTNLIQWRSTYVNSYRLGSGSAYFSSVTLPSGGGAATLNDTGAAIDIGLNTTNAGGIASSSDLMLETGNATGSGNSGDIKHRTGTVNTGVRGKLYFIDGTEGTSGHVWTSVGTGGQGGWAALPATGANTSLSNLSSVAVNADMNSDGAGTHTIGSLTNYYAEMRSSLFSAPSTGFINIADFADGGNGMLTLGLRTTPSGVANTVSIATAAGTITEAWRTGSWMSRNRADAANPTGSLLIETGNNTAASSTSGDVKVRMGTVGAGGTRGKFYLIDGTEGTSGHVWTSVGTGGQGGWAALPSSANTTLSNLGTTSVNADLLPSADDTRDIGSNSLQWQDIFAVNLHALTKINIGGANDTMTMQTATTPSGVASTPSITSGASPTNLAFFSPNDAVANSTATANVLIESGNKTAGTGNSGNVAIRSGTSAGGTRGNITMNAENVTMTAATAVDFNGSTVLGVADGGFNSTNSLSINAKTLKERAGMVKKIHIDYNAFTAAATTESITIHTLPAGWAVKNCVMKHSQNFTGGSVASATLSLGVTGLPTDLIATPLDVFAASSGTGFVNSTDPLKIYDFGASTSIIIELTTSGGNINTLTQGGVDVYMELINVAGNTTDTFLP